MWMKNGPFWRIHATANTGGLSRCVKHHSLVIMVISPSSFWSSPCSDRRLQNTPEICERCPPPDELHRWDHETPLLHQNHPVTDRNLDQTCANVVSLMSNLSSIKPWPPTGEVSARVVLTQKQCTVAAWFKTGDTVIYNCEVYTLKNLRFRAV